MKTINLTFISLAFLALTTLDVAAVITNNVPSAISSNKTFKLKGKKMNSRSNPFKATIAAYNSDGSVGEKLDISSLASLRKKQDKTYVVNLTVPNAQADLKVQLEFSGGNVPETDPQKFIALLLSDPNSDSNVELENDGLVLNSTGNNQEGPAGKDGVDGATGPSGPAGPKGDKGDPGALTIDGGEVDIDPLFNLFTPIGLPVLTRTIVDGIFIDLKGASYFKVIDSDTSTIDIIGNLKGAAEPGHKVTILFANDALVTNTEMHYPNTINLVEKSKSILRSGLENSKALSLTPGTYFESFEKGSTLELVFDGNSWFELHRSSTKDPLYISIED